LRTTLPPSRRITSRNNFIKIHGTPRCTPAMAGFVRANPGEISNIDEGRGYKWAEWNAAALNRLFQEQGVIVAPGGITAAAVLHGERRMTHDETKQSG
jgi:hypothetical protein